MISFSPSEEQQMIINTVKEFALEEPQEVTRILFSRLGEDAVSLGAVAFVLREMFSRGFMSY